EANQQFQRVYKMWKELFLFDRTLFGLTTILEGTGFSKGAMSHMLLANPQSVTGKELIPSGLPFDYEQKVIKYNLSKEKIPRALKNLLMLTGEEGFKKVNNSRTRKIILEFIFDRSTQELEGLAINYKRKLKKLVRHALGKQEVFKILNGDEELFNKRIGRYNIKSMPVVYHIFDHAPPKNILLVRYPKIERYWDLRTAAQDGNVKRFKKLMKGMPNRTVMGFRNTYKVNIKISEIYEQAKMGDREALQMESAVKRSGATKSKTINYKNQDIYDLWKAFYFKLFNGDSVNIEKIMEGIEYQSQKLNHIDIGECVVIIDASRSMMGSNERKMHPFLTSLSILSILDNVKDVIYVGGKRMETPTKDPISVIVPHNDTKLWQALIDAVISKPQTIIVISDGYENTIKGMFEHTYNHFKKSGYEFNLIHLNPVFSADAKIGTTRRLTADTNPLPVSNYKYLETEMIFNRMIDNREMVKKLLINKFNKQLK
ncbi:MAG: hypothetical protein DRN27_05565, partial [Thermoplasmata archaeon]